MESNSQWLTNRLKPLGFDIRERFIVRDEIPEIVKSVRRAIDDECNFIITSGGLGPTHDDLTLRGIAASFNLSMVVNKEALSIVTRQYTLLHQKGVIKSPKISESRRKMAIFPVGARPLDNRVGGAPGVILVRDNIEVICLPGVPHELMWITDNQLIPTLTPRIEGSYYEETFSLPLRDESAIAPIIDETMNCVPSVWIKSMVKPYGEAGIRFWVSARGSNRLELERSVKRAIEILRDLIGKNEE